MYYRYEIKNKEGVFVGLFCLLNPSQRRYFNRFVKEPTWYKNNPDTNSRCWFTEEGYEKYHNIIQISPKPQVSNTKYCKHGE